MDTAYLTGSPSAAMSATMIPMIRPPPATKTRSTLVLRTPASAFEIVVPSVPMFDASIE